MASPISGWSRYLNLQSVLGPWILTDLKSEALWGQMLGTPRDRTSHGHLLGPGASSVFGP